MRRNVFYEVLEFNLQVENQNGILKVIESNTSEAFQHSKGSIPFSDPQVALDFMENERLSYTYDEERARGTCTKLVLSAMVLDDADQLIRQVRIRQRHNLAQMAEFLGFQYDE